LRYVGSESCGARHSVALIKCRLAAQRAGAHLGVGRSRKQAPASSSKISAIIPSAQLRSRRADRGAGPRPRRARGRAARANPRHGGKLRRVRLRYQRAPADAGSPGCISRSVFLAARSSIGSVSFFQRRVMLVGRLSFDLPDPPDNQIASRCGVVVISFNPYKSDDRNARAISAREGHPAAEELLIVRTALRG
jgi:hypothetical protein